MMKKLGLFLLVTLVAIGGYAQDTAAFSWKVSSQRKEAGVYQLTFSADIRNNWQLYAPGQDISGIVSAEVLLGDSSIRVEQSLRAASEVKKEKIGLFGDELFSIQEKQAVWSLTIRISGEVPEKLLGTLQYTYGKGDEFYPSESFSFEVPLEGGVQVQNRILLETVDLKAPLADCATGNTTTDKQDSSLWNIFFLGFLGGLVALLTPCVFPMVPLTVSFFTKKAGEKHGTRNAVLYGFFIFLIYISFSIPFHVLGSVSPTIYNDISTNIWLNLAFFIVFIVFAISFFGYFEITLPSGFANTANARQGSNLLGIFFMALTLAIVSFSCTGPILGTLLVGSASEGAWPLTAGLAGFGVALGLPFGLFALFPNWLQSLPKSGGWLNTVKVVLGFVELALALKFLSNADLVAHWGILPRELFFGIWIVIGLGLFVYLMGWLRFPHDTPGEKIGLPRKFFAAGILAFTIYLMPGVTNTRQANLSLVSGFPPPHCYSLYADPVNCEEPLKDYEEALKLAKELNKPILLDFTGWACVNCRKMEENVWPDPRVKELMEQYVLVSLYVDDKHKLPISRQFTYTGKDGVERRITTVGDKWSAFQTENFNASSQPWYVLLTPDEKLLAPPVGYTPDKQVYANWLACGLEAFRAKTK
jgi:thiol:disulfide interchange protein DsbD